ncbi:neuralized E3 ubiquitin protein ligase 4 isoform X2 [Rhynchophorus ferrugineus]|uniref:neuralized E3 ubiquitin protein ligase 4 isoform X2 n=1 Tax=Rhynchophorus ferrugineus TaxID=354439 RepID=UPI003FCCB70D
MAYFHYRCGERITLINENTTAIRNDSEFDHGLVISAEPLMNDVLFEVIIDRKVNSWSGNLEIGIVDVDPLHFDFPPCASKIQSTSWIMSGTAVFKNGTCLIERYGFDLDKLNQFDRVGLVKTAEGDLIFYINGESQGVAAEGLPNVVYAIVDLYGKCVQVSITSPTFREHNNDECLSGSSVLAIENDVLNVTLGGDLSELSLSSSNSLDIRMDMNVSVNIPEDSARLDKMRFHERCGSLVKLSNNNRTAERRRPLDEFNNGVVMTNRPLKDGELFEIRIDRLVDKWSGSIEMGITTHNPNSLVFPATMTNMRSGTIMMSGCGILTNGKGTRREYGNFNLDELSEGDRVGMMRKPNGNLHYFINGLDQGIAAQRVPSTVWGVIDLYGMTIKVSIVERDEREEQNLITRKNTRDQQSIAPDPQPLPDYYDRLTFHSNCGTHAEVINNGRTAHRPNASDDFNNGVVLTARPLKTGEFFEVRLDKVVTKWAGSIEIGVTTHSPVDLEFPFTMTNVRSGTWMMTGSGIMHNGTIIQEQYGVNLDRLQVGDRVGLVRKENGQLHFFVNGVDQGSAANNVPEKVYGVVDLYGQAVGVTIIDMYDYASPDTINSSLSNATLYSDLRFHHVHGKNARIVNNGLTALRPRPLAEFNDAIVFSNRPLKDGELFEIVLDNIVERWSGSIELGVTAVRPDDIELPSTATDLNKDTWMLSGSSIMINGKTTKNNYPCDLDTLAAGVRLGVLRSTDKSLEFFKDGVSQGPACVVPHSSIYAVVDLYGQCARVSIPCAAPLVPLASAGMDTCPRSDTSVSLQATNVLHHNTEMDLHRFSEYHDKGVYLSENGRVASRSKEYNSSIVFSSTSLTKDEIFEVSILGLWRHMAGTLSVGITETAPNANMNSFPVDSCYLTGNELRYKNQLLQLFTPSFNWLTVGDRVGILQTQDSAIKIFINGEELPLQFPTMGENVWAMFELKGQCCELSVTSHKAPLLSPMNSARLQDSLEIVIDQEQAPSELEECSVAVEEGYLTSLRHFLASDGRHEFHENHGRNIELQCDKTVARRVASYNQGVVAVTPALETNKAVQVVLEHLDTHWQSSIIVGVVAGPLDRLILPVNALALKGCSCIVANDWISINGVKGRSNYGHVLNTLTQGDSIGVMITDSKYFKLIVNGVEEQSFPWPYPTGQPVYAVFDLYGQCQKIRILTDQTKMTDVSSSNTECEKADLEQGEKERCENNLTLPIPSTSLTSSNSVLKPSPTTSPLVLCMLKEECENFKKRLLPDHYFSSEEAICFCQSCYRYKNQVDDNEAKENVPTGWVKFPLKNLANVSTDKWHIAYYPTKIGAVRCILDKGQPLTKGQVQWCNFTAKKADDVQIVFYPSVDSCAVTPHDLGNKKVYTTFQIYVKPGAYSIAREKDIVEWSTKESGAMVLNSLLLQIK